MISFAGRGRGASIRNNRTATNGWSACLVLRPTQGVHRNGFAIVRLDGRRPRRTTAATSRVAGKQSKSEDEKKKEGSYVHGWLRVLRWLRR